MTPEEFLVFSRQMVVKSIPDKHDEFHLYDCGEPFFHAKRIPEMEEKLGEGSMAFCSQVTQTADAIFDVYFEKRDTFYTLEIYVLLESKVVRIHSCCGDKTGKDTNWYNDTDLSFINEEVQLITDMIREHPRFRLLFATGVLKINEE